MAQNEIAALARRMADMIAGLWDVIKSPNDPEQRADRIRADTTEILCEMADVVSWLEVRDDATAAERLTVRLSLGPAREHPVSAQQSLPAKCYDRDNRKSRDRQKFS